MSGLTDSTMTILSHALDGLTTRQALISSNLVNIDTPGYRPQSVDFETALQREVDAVNFSSGGTTPPSTGPAANVALKTTDPRHISSMGSGSALASATTSGFNENLRNDGNTVDLESEMLVHSAPDIHFALGIQAYRGVVVRSTGNQAKSVTKHPCVENNGI